MKRTRRTWLWILVAAAAVGLIVIIGAAAASIVFVSRHVEAHSTTPADALAAFEQVRARFENGPLYEFDADDRPFAAVELSSLPTSSVHPSSLMIQAWNPRQERLVRMSLPFWLLRLAPDDMRFSKPGHDHGFDFHQLNLDVRELERIGPALVIDYRNEDGVRVLLWTD
ncbi:MAG: hypothetical protein DIU54_011430 [Acidobacteriota bacterium]|jgi:hypothetical protein|nr:MAG: hypothetical protein DIU54_12100 [Acidobacteriota bacterium]